MAEIANTTRFMQIKTQLGNRILRLVDLSVTEALNEPFEMQLVVLARDNGLQPEEILQTPVSIALHQFPESPPRYFHGLVVKMQPGSQSHDLYYYHFTVRPWLWLLNLSTDYRIFQNMTVIEIISQLFHERNFCDFSFEKIDSNSYPVKDYCVQYGETTLQFVHRLLEEAGIFYYFRYSEHKHQLILGDCHAVFERKLTEPLSIGSTVSHQYAINRWVKQAQLYPGHVCATDYNFETPEVGLGVNTSMSPKLAAAAQHVIYQYPGRYGHTQAGLQHVNDLAQMLEQRAQSVSCETNALPLGAGSLFTVAEGDKVNDYLITHICHRAYDRSQEHKGAQSYYNQVTCLHNQGRYRPLPVTPKPTIHSPQSARIVGPEQVEIFVDNYGRVRVQFFWDRNERYDGLNSCWLRVMQPWAGNGFGAQFIPRVGQEVIVQFINGDPDQPLIVGCVYDASQALPYDIPMQQTRSGIKTRSFNQTDTHYGNELFFDDACNKERIFIYGRKDLECIVENNHHTTVIGGDQLVDALHGSIKLNADKRLILQVANNFIEINQESIIINGAEVLINK